MIALKVQLNGEILHVAGQEDFSVLFTNIVATQQNPDRNADDYVRLGTSGLSRETDEGYSQHFRWAGVELEIGDVVEIEIIDTDMIDAPQKRYRSDDKVQESPFTGEEEREMRYQDFLRLKEEFEGGNAR